MYAQNVRTPARGALFSLKKPIRFCLMCKQWIYIFEGMPKSFKDVIGDAFCHCRFCSRQTWKTNGES